jgi:hypothetical protein
MGICAVPITSSVAESSKVELNVGPIQTSIAPQVGCSNDPVARKGAGVKQPILQTGNSAPPSAVRHIIQCNGLKAAELEPYGKVIAKIGAHRRHVADYRNTEIAKEFSRPESR